MPRYASAHRNRFVTLYTGTADRDALSNAPNHCVKSVSIRSYSGLHFPAFGLDTEKYFVSLRIQPECGKMLTRITPNTYTFYEVNILTFLRHYHKLWGKMFGQGFCSC